MNKPVPLVPLSVNELHMLISALSHRINNTPNYGERQPYHDLLDKIVETYGQRYDDWNESQMDELHKDYPFLQTLSDDDLLKHYSSINEEFDGEIIFAIGVELKYRGLHEALFDTKSN